MSLKIIKDSDEYDVPANFMITATPFSRRINLSNRAQADGGANSGDGKVNPRIITLSGQLWGESDSEFEAKYDALVLKLMQNDFYLRNGNWQILIHAMQNYDPTIDKGLWKRLEEGEFELVALDPFWYYTALSSKEETITTDPQSFVANNEGNYDVYPVITITAAANNLSMSLKNETDEDVLFSYVDGGFTTGKVLVVDCGAGTVELDGVDTIRYFSGQFLRLLPGNNTLTYTGANATVKVEWYKRKL